MANTKDQFPTVDRASNDRHYRSEDSINFDDDGVISDRDNHARTGGSWAAQGGDSGKLAPPREIVSGRNGPGDTDNGGSGGTKRLS